MLIKKENNNLYINEIVESFDNNIEQVLEFPNYCVILLMNDNVPDNNIIAIKYDGKVAWNISEIIQFQYPEAYISITKENDNVFSAVTYNGVKFYIDTIKNKIIEKKFTK